MLGFSFVATIVLTVCLVQVCQGGDRVVPGRAFATRSEVIARSGMAATSHPLATQIALDVLKSGGSAVDAAIAANAALGLMEPTGCGIGGDLFALVWDAKTARLYALNASGRSPRGLSLLELKRLLGDRRSIPAHGPLPVTVPGCVDGWFELHARFGRRPMLDLLAPAIAAARDGFPVTEVIAHYWERGGEVLKDQPGFAETFLPGGRAPQKGEIFRNPALSRTLTQIASGGRDAFYRGELAERMDRFLQRVGGRLRRADFEAHASEWVEPLSTVYRGCEVWQIGPNTQGAAVLQILNLLEPLDLRSMGHNSADALHWMIEAKKLAYEDRARCYADPAFVGVALDALISKDYAAQRRALIDAGKAADAYPPGDIRVLMAADSALRDGDTVYLTVADAERNMVSLIQSNYRGFGSGLCPDDMGFCLQDRGELFHLDPAHPNAYAPGKRPFHTIIPGFVTRNGKPWLSFGVMGGGMQPQGHVQVLCNLIDFGMNLQEAGDAARWYHTGSSEPTGEGMEHGGTLALESGVPPAVRTELERRGHRMKPAPGAFGGYQAIVWDEARGVYVGASESRKDGQAAGY